MIKNSIQNVNFFVKGFGESSRMHMNDLNRFREIGNSNNNGQTFNLGESTQEPGTFDRIQINRYKTQQAGNNNPKPRFNKNLF